MSKAARRIVLFLGDDRAARAAERFNAVAGTFGLPWAAQHRTLADATAAVLEAAARLVALATAAAASFPAFADRIEIWPDESEARVNQLVARLLGGGAAPPPEEPEPPAEKKPAKDAPPVKVGRETKGRKGKGVTLVWDLPLDAAGILALAARLKERCGCGGTVEGDRIVIQGDQRERVIAELEKLGYRVKRVGG